MWFQLKGRHATSLSAEDLQLASTVSVHVRLDHLKFWFAQPEPVYVVVYLEASDEFIMEDVRDIVDRQWGVGFLSGDAFTAGQVEITVHVARGAVLDEDRLAHLQRHRSMRVDGPQWRGRPLGHRFDPLRSAMAPMEPSVYRKLVTQLLDVHGFEEIEVLNADDFLGENRPGNDQARLSYGRMHYTYEWTHPLFTEFGYGPGDTFRIEGAPMFVQGPCAVLIHEQVGCDPDTSGFADLAARLRDEYGVDHMLAFVNQRHEPGHFGNYFAGARPLRCVPQDLSSLPFNVLTATTVFLEFGDQIQWEYVNYL